VLEDELGLHAREQLLVDGASEATGPLVASAVLHGAQVIATAGPPAGGGSPLGGRRLAATTPGVLLGVVAELRREVPLSHSVASPCTIDQAASPR
jgi:hypothetical protein